MIEQIAIARLALAQLPLQVLQGFEAGIEAHGQGSCAAAPSRGPAHEPESHPGDEDAKGERQEGQERR